MGNPLVSILVPNYNKEKWLTETLFSAFGQTYDPIEVILYDDCSSDNSNMMVVPFFGIANFTYSRGTERSKHLSVSFNKALSLAKGEYVAVLGSDDIMLPYHIEDLMEEAIADPRLDFLFGNMTLIDQNRKVILGPSVPIEDVIFDRCSVGLSTSIIKRSVLVEMGGFDEDLGFSEDWELIIRLFKKNVPRKYVNESGYLGRRPYDEDTFSKKAGTFSPDFLAKVRIEGHSHIRTKHGLQGPCRCGCGALPRGTLTVTESMLLPIKENQTISVSMIVKNEETVLEACLNTIKGADEIVVLDTGSTDGTPDIVRKYTDKYVFGEYVWNDNFAEARNESLKRCTGDWILIIDADEHLEEGGIQKIRDLIKTIRPGIDGVGFRTISDRGALLHESVRLFRNNVGVQWHGAIHNYLSVRAQLSSDITLYYGYSPAHEKDPDRAFRILTKEIEKHPEALRERFYLAREYYYRKDWNTAIGHYRMYLEKAFWVPEKAEAWMQVSRCYNALGMNLEARLACLRAIEVNPDFKDALILMSDLSVDLVGKAKWAEYATLAKNSNTLFCSTR
jgi:glycosyltransferase involved in cell wall biosynthesis